MTTTTRPAESPNTPSTKGDAARAGARGMRPADLVMIWLAGVGCGILASDLYDVIARWRDREIV